MGGTNFFADVFGPFTPTSLGSPEIGPGVLIGTSNSSITSSTGSPTVIATTTNSPSTTSSTIVLNAQDSLSASVAGPSIKVSIVGGVVGGIALVVIAIAVLGVCYTRRQRSKVRTDAREDETFKSNDGALASPESSVSTLSITPTRVYALFYLFSCIIWRSFLFV